MPTYDKTKPDVDESPFVAPGQLQDNFSVIKTTVEQDHQWDDTPVADSGKHDKSTYTEQDDPPTTISNETAIYAIEDPESAKAQLYMRRESSTGDLSVPDKDLSIFGVAAAGLFQGTAVTGAATKLGKSNVNMTANRDGKGLYTCTFTNAMPTANYMVAVSIQYTPSGVTDNLICWRLNTKSTASMQIVFTSRIGGSNGLIDPTSWNAIVYGGLVA